MKIRVCKDGPYIVTGGIPLSAQIIVADEKGESVKWQEAKKHHPDDCYALCRCGRSKDKPYCDGTHEQVGFDGTETAGNEPYLECAKRYNGPELALTDDEKFCAHARFCLHKGDTWRLTLKSRHPEAREEAIRQAGACPSGRLVVWDKEGAAIEPEFPRSIGLVEDVPAGRMGPIWVRGKILIESAGGTAYELRNRVTLCRCGKSAIKPFCDGRHLD